MEAVSNPPRICTPGSTAGDSGNGAAWGNRVCLVQDLPEAPNPAGAHQARGAIRGSRDARSTECTRPTDCLPYQLYCVRAACWLGNTTRSNDRPSPVRRRLRIHPTNGVRCFDAQRQVFELHHAPSHRHQALPETRYVRLALMH